MAMYEIRTIVEDRRADTLGALNLAFTFWEQSVLSMLLFNCESWTGIQRKTLKVLDNLFLTFFHYLGLRTCIWSGGRERRDSF